MSKLSNLKKYIKSENVIELLGNQILEIKSLLEHLIEEYSKNKSLLEHLIEEDSKNKYFNYEFQKVKNNKISNKILICGFFGAFNTGDELMLNAVLKRFSNKENIWIMISDNETIIPSFRYPGYNFVHYFSSVTECELYSDFFDTVIWAGGAHIDDNNFSIGNGSFTFAEMYCSLSLAMINKGKKVISYGLSSNYKLSNKKYRKYLKYIIENSKYFSVRDILSKQVVTDFCHPEKEISIDHDLVIADRTLASFINREKVKSNIITIIFIYDEKNFDVLKKIVNVVNSKYNSNCQIRLLSFYDYHEYDCKKIEKIMNELQLNNIVCQEPIIDIDKLCKYLSESDTVIAMRYHAHLLSNILGINTITILYDQHDHYPNKMLATYKMYNFPEKIIYLSDLSNENGFAKFNELLNTESNIYKFQKEIVYESAKKLDLVISNAIEL